MTAASRILLWQLYLLVVCLLSVLVMGVAGTMALVGSLRVHYPTLMLAGDTWDETASFESYVARHPPRDGEADSTASTAAWHDNRRFILMRERHLGRRQMTIWTVTALVAVAIFLPHWWLARRVAFPRELSLPAQP